MFRMQCNIDRRGRTLRTAMGILTAAIGCGLVAPRLMLFMPFMPCMPAWAFWAGIAAIVGGAFMVFEGVNGWCAVRAMGFKTPV